MLELGISSGVLNSKTEVKQSSIHTFEARDLDSSENLFIDSFGLRTLP